MDQRNLPKDWDRMEKWKIVQRHAVVETMIGSEQYAIAHDVGRWCLFQRMCGGYQFILGFDSLEDALAKLTAMRIAQ